MLIITKPKKEMLIITKTKERDADNYQKETLVYCERLFSSLERFSTPFANHRITSAFRSVFKLIWSLCTRQAGLLRWCTPCSPASSVCFPLVHIVGRFDYPIGRFVGRFDYPLYYRFGRFVRGKLGFCAGTLCVPQLLVFAFPLCILWVDLITPSVALSVDLITPFTTDSAALYEASWAFALVHFVFPSF